MRYSAAALVLTFVPLSAHSADNPVILEQVVSRHDPALNVTSARLAVGLDGNIYIGSGGYVLRVSPDGKTWAGGKAGYALTCLAANKDGVIATSEAHFQHRVAFWSKDFAPLGNVADFLVSDAVQWNAPSDVCAGESGNFYGMDQHRLRILKVKPPDKLVEAVSLEQLGVQSNGSTVGLRVDEKRQRFLVAWRGGTIYAVGFDGKPLWNVKPNPVGEPPGGFDVGPDGKLYAISGDETVRLFDTDGKPAGETKLKNDSTRKPAPVHDLRVLGEELIVRRDDPAVLFEVHALADGKWKRAVRADVDVLTARYPSAVWTAGKEVPFEISFDAGPRLAKPRFRVLLRPLGVPEFTELTQADGKITVPADARGLYQVRVTPDIGGRMTDYLVDGLVEIRPPDAVGSVSIFTPLNRFYFGAGEDIPVSVVVRTKDKPVESVKVVVKGPGGIVHEEQVTLNASKGEFKISAKETEDWKYGPYVLDADVPGFTVAPQHLQIGPGLGTRPKFHVVQHGDYSVGFPTAKLFDMPEAVADHLSRSGKLGLNLFVDRLGNLGNGVTSVAQDGTLTERLHADPLAVAPEKSIFEGSVRRSIAAYGAHGIEEQAILLNMDAGLPIGTLWDNRKPEQMDKDLRAATEALKPYPAFRGWSWAANWWLEKHGAAAADNPAEYNAALKKAKDTGAWSPILDTVSDRTFSHALAAEKRFRAIVNDIVPGKLSAMTGPYRAIETHPPTIFANADEVDLHYQAEQIQPPQVTAHHVDFYKRPGKPAWGHPELWNDDGTGGMICPALLQMVMRGADGIGQSGAIGPPFGTYDAGYNDPRNGVAGTPSVYRALYELLHRYSPLLSKLENADRVAIVVSTRMQRIETWDGKIGSAYFDSLYEAYNACLYAHRPASFVFVEDLKKDTLTRFKAILVVGQRVELDPPLASALADAKKKGIHIYHDGGCRPELVKEFTPLDITFDKVKSDPSAWQDDSAYERIPKYFKDDAVALNKVLGAMLPPVAECENPEILLTERKFGNTRYIWAVNNTMLDIGPGLAWRSTLLISQRLPVVEKLKLDIPEGYVVRDVFADKELKPEKGVILCDLRTIPARLFEIALPGGKHEPSKRPAAENLFGPHLRDIALSADGKTAVLNSFNWDQNLYGIDLANGEIRWRGKVGDTFAFDPGADAQGFTVQGFDLLSAEGYHLYTLDTQGKVDKRFALYGLPNRATNWACAGILQEPGINAFAESPDGSWIAAAGNLGLIVWDRKGNELWNDSWWKTSRKHVRLVALDAKTLVVLDGTTATARNASNGERLWSLTLADSGELRGGTVSGDRKTLVIHADTLGGRLFVIRAGRLVNTIVTAADEVAVNADGSQIAVTGRRQLKVIDSATGLLWSFTGDDHLHHPRISPDGKRVAVGSELGTLTVLDINGKVLSQRDLHAWPIPTWLPDNDLLVATWMGQVARFDSDMIVRWQVKLTPGEASSFNRPAPLSARPPITTVRKTGWGNATDKPLPLTPNLLSENKALIGAICNPKAHGDPRPWQNKIETLTDGKADAPPKPWLEWTDINYIDSGWRSKLTLEVDAFRTQLHLTGITFVEDPEHPESWLRDMRLEWWDAAKEAWIPGPYLLSNSATHSHVLDKPIEAAKFRFVSTGGGTWPIGNIRLAELVFHGQTLGCSHPDVVAKRPVAVLFDESETDLACMTGSRGYRYTGAFSGGKCFELKEGTSGPEYRPPFGHAIPNWDFEIAEKPEPGQYRFLRFAWKAGSDKTTGMSLLVGRAWPGGGIAATIGDAKWKEGVIAEQRLDGPTPKEWQEVTIDLWKMSNGKPPRIQALMLSTVGGSALFDRIVLARTEADLPKAPSR